MLKLQYFGHLMKRADVLEKTLMLRKTEGKRRRGWQRMKWPITNSRSLFRYMSIESVVLYNHLILCHPLHLWPLMFPSIKVFSNESALHILWPKYWSFSISPSNEYSEHISFRMDWLGLLGWFPLGLTSLISLLSKELSRIFSSTSIQKHQFFSPSLL